MTTAMDRTDPVIEEREQRGMMRHPSDLLRLLFAVFFTVIGFLLATTLSELSEAITVEVIEGVDALPNEVIVAGILTVELFALFLPVFAVGYMMWLRRWRRLALALVASVAAIGILVLIEEFLVSRFSPPDLPFSPPSWVCPPGVIYDSILSCVPGSQAGIADLVYITGGVAFFSALAPWMTRAWRRFAWGTMLVVIAFRMISSLEPPVDEFLAVGLAYAIGAAVLLVFGEPDRRPRGRDVVIALARSGFAVSHVKRAGVDARGSVPYFVSTKGGRELFVKVLSPEERAADILFRILRMFRLKGVGDERPFSSLKRGIEHEAVASLKAGSDGVRTPRLEAVAEVLPNSMLIAYEMIDGSSLDGVEPDELTDDVLRGVWGQVETLRNRRTAHRDLRLANVFLGSDGAPWLIDFGFAELAATDGQLRSDIAELTTSTATVIGPQRAVANAVAGVGPVAVADAAQRIQPLALSGATREALKRQKGLDDELRKEIERQTGSEPVELEDLERVKTRTVLMTIGFALAVYFLIPQLAQTDFGAVLNANWLWAPAILGASVVTYVGAAYNVMGSVPDRVRLLPSVLAQFAGTFINRITPIKVGGMATNVRYLQKNGVESAVAISGVGISSVATFIVHMSLLVLTVFFLGRNAGNFISLPSGNTVLLVLVAVFGLSGLLLFLPFFRRIFTKKVWPLLKQSGRGLAQVASTPANAVMLFGGAFMMIAAYIAALWFSLEAFGGGLGIAAAALVFLGGQALGQMAPTPGGIGATEAAMIAAMTALGVDASVAVPSVFLYRIATFWLPIVPGVFSLRKLEADGLL